MSLAPAEISTLITLINSLVRHSFVPTHEVTCEVADNDTALKFSVTDLHSPERNFALLVKVTGIRRFGNHVDPREESLTDFVRHYNAAARDVFKFMPAPLDVNGPVALLIYSPTEATDLLGFAYNDGGLGVGVSPDDDRFGFLKITFTSIEKI